MIIPNERFVEYIMNSDSYLEEITSQKTLQKLRAYESRIHQPPLSITDNLFLEHQDNNKSLRTIAKNIGITAPTLSKIFYHYNLPIKTQAEAKRENWKDEEFRKRNAEATREARKSKIPKIKIPADPEGRGIFNPPTGNDGRGRASGYYTQL